MDRKKLYKKWKKAGMGMSGMNAVRRTISIEGIEGKKEFPTEGDIRNLILIFRKYDKNADGPLDWIKLWAGLFLIGAFFTVGLQAFPNVIAGVITQNAMNEISIISGAIILFEFILLAFYARKYNHLDSLSSIPDSPKGIRFLIFECTVALLALLLSAWYIVRSYDGIGLFS